MINQVANRDSGDGAAYAAGFAWRGGDVPARAFFPYLDEGAGAVVHLLARGDDGDGGPASVWRDEGGPMAVAPSELFAWMWSRPDRWLPWGRVAVGLGSTMLSRIIGHEFASPAPAGLPGPGDDDDGDGATEKAPGSIWCGISESGRGRYANYDLWLRRGDFDEKPFFTLRYKKASERDRVWDWMGHACGRYREFEDCFWIHGRDALKKLIYRGMLETERAVKKAGMGSGGLRPLRFWPGPDETDA